MKKVMLVFSLVMVRNVGAMELSQEFKQYLFDHQLPTDHPWREKKILDDEINIRDTLSGAEIAVAKRFAIEKIIKAHHLTQVTLVPGYVKFSSDEEIESASDITSETTYKVFQEEQDDGYVDDDATLKAQEAEEIMTLLKCTNMSITDIYVNENGVYLKPGHEQEHFVDTWTNFWDSGFFTFDEQATACMKEKQKYLRAYVLKCLKNYAWENPNATIEGKCTIRLPLLPEPDEIPLEGQERIQSLAFNSTDLQDLFHTNKQRASLWKEYDENRAEVQRWWDKDFFKGPFDK